MQEEEEENGGGREGGAVVAWWLRRERQKGRGALLQDTGRFYLVCVTRVKEA